MKPEGQGQTGEGSQVGASAGTEVWSGDAWGRSG